MEHPPATASKSIHTILLLLVATSTRKTKGHTACKIFGCYIQIM